MSSDRVVYVAGVQFAPRVLSNTVGTSVIYRSLREIDMGRVARTTWEDERPLLDGKRRRGSVFGARDMTWKIQSSVNRDAVTAANVERARHAEEAAILDLLLPNSGLLTVKVTGVSYAGAATSRVIYAEPMDVQGWKWQRSGLDDGHVGRHDMPILVTSVPWHAPFPWWQDETATATAALSLTTSLQTTTITNLGHRPCGLKFNIEGSGSGLDVVVTNATTGVNAAIGGPGVTLDNITLHATNGHVVDQFVDAPQRFLAYREADSSSIRDKLLARPRVWLQKGANTISYQVTAGSPTGATIQFYHRNLWGSP